MARTPESAAVDFAESSLFTGRFSILALAACGVGFSLSGRLPAAIFSLAAAAVAAAARLWARHVLDGVNARPPGGAELRLPRGALSSAGDAGQPQVAAPGLADGALPPGAGRRPPAEHRWETVELPEGRAEALL
ncbi:MAG: hypothetical protein ACLTYN_02930 [Dysosmobacter welbionis]